MIRLNLDFRTTTENKQKMNDYARHQTLIRFCEWV